MTFGFFNSLRIFVAVPTIMFSSICNDLICKKTMWNTTGLLIYSLQLMAKEYFPSEKTTAEWTGPALATHSKAKTKNVLDTVKRACAQIHTDTRAHTNRVCTGHTLSSIHKYDEYACLCAISKTMTVNIKTVLFSKDKYNKDCERTEEGESQRGREERQNEAKNHLKHTKKGIVRYMRIEWTHNANWGGGSSGKQRCR